MTPFKDHPERLAVVNCLRQLQEAHEGIVRDARLASFFAKSVQPADPRDKGLWVIERRFADAIRANRLTVEGKPLSVTKFKSALNWMVRHGYVTRVRWELFSTSEGESLVQIKRGDRRDIYDTDIECWQYFPTEEFRLLLPDTPVRTELIFAS